MRRIAEAFSGGGHVRAAGCTINEPLDQAIKLLLEKIDVIEGINQ